MSDLHDMAKDLGVETHGSFNFHTQIHDGQGDYAPLTYPRPDLDIAHECLAKLPHGRAQVISKSNGEHIAIDPQAPVSNLGYFNNFPDCVVALWKRRKAST